MTEQRLENVLGALVMCLSDDIVQSAQATLPKELAAPAAAITLIGHVPGLTIRYLSLALGLSHPGAVRLVDRLVAQGAVTRESAVDDGRAVALTLTDYGQALNRKALQRRADRLGSVLNVLNTEDRTALARIAEKLLRNALADPVHALKICRLCDDEACVNCPVEAELESRQSMAP